MVFSIRFFSVVYLCRIVEEIDDSLEFDCSSQESTDSESEEHEFHACVEPERDPQDKEFNIQSGLAKQSNRPPINRKTKLVQNEDGKTSKRYIIYKYYSLIFCK